MKSLPMIVEPVYDNDSKVVSLTDIPVQERHPGQATSGNVDAPTSSPINWTSRNAYGSLVRSF